MRGWWLSGWVAGWLGDWVASTPSTVQLVLNTLPGALRLPGDGPLASSGSLKATPWLLKVAPRAPWPLQAA